MLIGAVARRRKYSELTRGAVALMGVAGLSLFFVATSGHPEGFLAGLGVGVAASVVVVAVTRALAERTLAMPNRVGIALLVVFNAIVGVGLIIAPILAMNAARVRGLAADILGFGALTNFFTGAVAASFALLPLMLLLQMVVWPVVHRPLYALARFKIFQKRKWLFGASCVLLAFGSPELASWLLSARAIFAQ